MELFSSPANTSVKSGMIGLEIMQGSLMKGLETGLFSQEEFTIG
jgi:hypothetical protein